MGYLANESGPVTLVLDLRITHDRVGRSSDLSLNGNLRYPNDKDRSINKVAADKILKYRADYNNTPHTHCSLYCNFRSAAYAIYQWRTLSLSEPGVPCAA